ncbi:hypothetical protein KC850_00405 [Candidatus Kaiserbacteria bacterium]|nr:hypothetical protein [Candidatus Kaiserbacteria bacterium]
MYQELMSNESYSFVLRATQSLSRHTVDKGEDGGYWVNYGSFVINTQQPNSDIDLLYVHQNPEPVSRMSASFEGHPVTIYQLSEDDLLNDGEMAKFGGYFSGKLLNPFVILSEDSRHNEVALRSAGSFIGPHTVHQTAEVNTPERVLKDTVLARLKLCPWYDSYFLRYYTHPDFERIWEVMLKVVCRSLEISGDIQMSRDGYRYVRAYSEQELHERSVAVIARFWSLGSCLHSSMPDFPDFYMKKARQHVETNQLKERLEEMMRFLHAP